jgi:hypothetical protein
MSDSVQLARSLGVATADLVLVDAGGGGSGGEGEGRGYSVFVGEGADPGALFGQEGEQAVGTHRPMDLILKL